jgi:hypothetical protein
VDGTKNAVVYTFLDLGFISVSKGEVKEIQQIGFKTDDTGKVQAPHVCLRSWKVWLTLSQVLNLLSHIQI